MTRYITLLILNLLFNQSLAISQEWKTKAVIEYESASSFEFSPDGNHILWIKRIPDTDKDRFISKLFLTNLNQKEKATYENIQLTYGNTSEREALFSKDGKSIYFLSNRKKETILFKLNANGGEANEFHQFDQEIEQLKFIDNETLAFVAEEGKWLREIESEKKKDDVVAVEDTSIFKPKRLFTFNLETKEIKRISTNNKQIASYSVSKSGTWIAYTQVMSPHYGSDGKPSPTHFLINLKTNEESQILKEGFQTPGSFQFTNDDNYLYFDAVTSSNPEWEGAGISEVYRMSLDRGSIIKVNLGNEWGVGYGGWMVFANGILFHEAKGVLNPISFVEFNKKGGWTKSEVDLKEKNGRVFIRAMSLNHNKVVYTYSNASTPIQYMVTDLSKKRKKSLFENDFPLVKLNAHFDKLPKSKTEIIKWVGAKGDSIEGILYYPINFDVNRKYPLAITPHGGPMAADLDSWSDRWAYFPHLLAEMGIFTLKPNYHGSSNYGLEFLESIKFGNYYDLEMVDIINGINYLEKKNLISRDSLIALGWSNGAILSTMLSVRYPEMFKVVVAGAGDVNWTSDFGTCAFGVTFDQSYFGGAPWDDKNGKTYNENYILKSPLFELEKVKTPTLIFHGSEDRSVPRDQGWEYYRALQQTDKAPVRFLWFPGQPHGLGKLTHQYRKVEEEITWIKKYLFGIEPEAYKVAYKKDSPLAQLEKQVKFAISNGLFGKLVDGVLIPETVSLGKDSVSIGRFEITNAQYASFKSDFNYDAVKGNFPVSGISHNDAIEYAKWLSQKTGETYRLPTKKEAEVWIKETAKINKKENTLTYWAGYDLTYDDAILLQPKMIEFKEKVIKQVGSFDGFNANKDYIFDWKGNVRELTQDSSLVIGYSAIDYSDLSHPLIVDDSSFVGFRIVLEAKPKAKK